MTSPGAGGPAGGDLLARLRHELQVLRRRSGEPSCREISRRTDAISHSTVAKVLRCDVVPQCAQLELVVEVLGGNVEEFKRLWIAVRDAQEPIPPVEATVTLTGTLDADPAGPAAVVSVRLLSRGPDNAEKLSELRGGLSQALEQALDLLAGVLAEPSGIPWMGELIRRLEASSLVVLGVVESAFRLSWQHLRERDDQAAGLLLLLSVNPGPDISTEAAVALGGTAEQNVRGLLQVLRHAHLINYDDASRWWMHVPVRHYVDELAVTELCADDRYAAFGRLLSHYQERATDVARKAGSFLLRHSRPGPKPDPCDEPPTWTGRTDALRYFKMEHLNLLGCLHHAAEHVHVVPESDLSAQLVALTDAMAGYLRNNGPWDTAEQANENAAGIAKRLGYTSTQAVALNDLGITRRLRGNLEGADQALQEAREIFRGLSDTRTSRLGQANTLNEMGLVANETGRRTGDRDHHKHAVKVLTEAWELYDDSHVDDTIGKANSAKNLGVALYRLSGSTDAAEAVKWLNRSLANYSEIEDVLGVVEVRNHLGLLYLESRDQEKALVEFEKAVNLMTEKENEIGSLLEEARAYEGIGLCREKNGEVADAMMSFEKAEVIYSRIRADQASDRVTRKLDELRGDADP